jgi:transposase
VGRKSKLTPDTEKRLLDLIRAGVPKKEAAQAAGMSERTFYEHQDSNLSFRSAVEKAFAECCASKVLRVRKAEEDTWTAAAWWLERRMRKEFGRVDRVEQTGPDGGPVQHNVTVDLKALSTHDLKELHRIQLAATKNGNGSSDSERSLPARENRRNKGDPSPA